MEIDLNTALVKIKFLHAKMSHILKILNLG
jgi:hypothetical protein